MNHSLKANIAILLMAAFAITGAQIGCFSRTGSASSAVQYAPGDRVPSLGSVRFSDSANTIVLFVSPSCRYCTDNVDLYRALAAERDREPEHLRLVVAGTEPVALLDRFATAYGLHPDHVVSVRTADVSVRAIPTIILVSAQGIVQKVWVGEQGPPARAGIIATLRQQTS